MPNTGASGIEGNRFSEQLLCQIKIYLFGLAEMSEIKSDSGARKMIDGSILSSNMLIVSDNRKFKQRFRGIPKLAVLPSKSDLVVGKAFEFLAMERNFAYSHNVREDFGE